MKQGFLLIEVIVALAIASTLAGSLLILITQMAKVQQSMDAITDAYTRTGIVQRLFERELEGVFIPNPIPAPAPASSAPPAKQSSSVPIEKPFVVAYKDKKMDLFTFITTNPVAATVEDNKIKPTVRAARIVYRLQPQKGQSHSYVLMRQEATDFDLKKFNQQKGVPALEVIQGIKELTFSFWTKKQNKEGNQEWKLVSGWPEKQENQKELAELPDQVTMTLVLWNNSYKQEQSFTFTIPILVQKKQEQKQQTEEKKPEQKAAPTPAKPQVPAGPPPPKTAVNNTQKVEITENIIMVVPA